MIATAPRSPIPRSGRPAQTAPSRSLSSITHPFHVSMPPPAGSSPLRRRLILDGEEIPLVLLQGIPHPGEQGDRIGAPSPLTPLLRHGYRHPAPPPRNPSRWRSSPSTSSKAPFIIGFLSCLACLYVAGRLWQDFESRILLSVLHCNSDQRPKVLMVEDKLMDLGCKEIGRKLVEAEIDLLLAKNQAYIRKNGDGSKAACGCWDLYWVWE